MRAYWLPAVGALEDLELPDDSSERLREMQRLLGGNIEVFRPIEQFPGWTAYVAEEPRTLTPNHALYDIALLDGPHWFSTMWRGDAILLGFDWRTGESHDVPDPIHPKILRVLDEAGRMPPGIGEKGAI
jgi:hypothetical protein